ncbi:MAG TPA: hypothetical protein VNI35_08545, partial [Nitrospira sp.]|nr:hypothetical protein [Nitrospira sp.]
QPNIVGDDAASETDTEVSGEKRGSPQPELGKAPQSISAAPDTELAGAKEVEYHPEVEVALLLDQAEDQVAKLALTTPKRDNAYETYQLILSLQPNNGAALAGIEQIGVKYVDLAKQAAAKGNVLKARQYAAKAAELAPGNPLVQSMTLPVEPEKRASEESVSAPKPSESVASPQGVSVESEVATTKIEALTATSTSVTPKGLMPDVNDLIFQPHNYLGRQVVVTGSVVDLFWDYRLKAETGQNSIVINVARLSPANRAELAAAIDGAGFLGQVHARIKGRVEHQTLATYELVATELTLIDNSPTKGEALAPDPVPDLGAATPLVAPADSVESLVLTEGSSNQVRPDEGDQAGATAADSNGQSSGNANRSAGGTLADRSHTAPIIAPVRYNPAPVYVPTCYRDVVWRRLPDGRIQTGLRTRCY